jgi:hypothetical protein
MAFTRDTTIGELIANPQAKAVLDKQMPGLADNPMIAMVKGMSLNMLLSMPQAAQLGITKEKVDALLVEVNKQVKM